MDMFPCGFLPKGDLTISVLIVVKANTVVFWNPALELRAEIVIGVFILIAQVSKCTREVFAIAVQSGYISGIHGLSQ